ncbi:MAG: dockerin type I domain-containing protein [Pirellulaceae bacterium]
MTLDVSFGGWQNPRNSMDVNDDGLISPIDALLVVNSLNRGGAGRRSAGRSLSTPTTVRRRKRRRLLSPVDALLVINYLNQRSAGEGEAPIVVLTTTSDDVPQTSLELASLLDGTASRISTPALMIRPKRSESPAEDRSADSAQSYGSSSNQNRDAIFSTAFRIPHNWARLSDLDKAICELADELDSRIEAPLAR